jgi:cytochrome c peroxidase
MRQAELFWNPSGRLGTFLATGAIDTTTHPFFQPLGTNGRSCATCHQPPSALGLSARNVRARFTATQARDPLFAPIDGANCPTVVPARTPGSSWQKLRAPLRAAYSLLLARGTIRMSLPWPPRNPDGTTMQPEFTLEVAPGDDRPGCNLDPVYGLPAGWISIYRRPPMVAQMNFKTLRTGGAGPILPGSLMWDGREASLEQQASNAVRGHAQGVLDPSPEQLAQIVAFQNNFFAAQVIHNEVGRLDQLGGLGGPINLQRRIPVPSAGIAFNEYDGWSQSSGAAASIARGQALFNIRIFTASNVDGFNDRLEIGNPNIATTCSSCHGVANSGGEFRPFSQTNIGVGGSGDLFGGTAASGELPKFTLTCASDQVLGFHGVSTLVVNDPGLALVTGKCADIGKFTVPQLRGLAAHAPYFHDGSAEDLDAVVEFYQARFTMGLTAQEQRDLVAFLASL